MARIQFDPHWLLRLQFKLSLCVCSVEALGIAAALLTCSSTAPAAEVQGDYVAGVAKVDITPSYPIRLNGFGGRRTESEGISQPIWAKALAIGSDEQGPLVLISVDNLGIRMPMVEEVAARLEQKASVSRSRVAVVFSHSHTTPMVKGSSETIFSTPIPPEHQAHIDRYTTELTDWLEEVALAALADRRPARLEWGVGNVGFAVNRRTRGGPVDHGLPMLAVKSPGGEVRAVYVTYACHCVTLSHNKISGDWAGYAQAAIERRYPDAVALVSIGCGSDANPNSGVTGDNFAVASSQGDEIADEVDRLLQGPLRPVRGATTSQLQQIELPLNPPPSPDELEALAAGGGPGSYNAQYHLNKLDAGEDLLTAIDYPVQSWTFGDSLHMVFLAGEVCVDYAIRLREEIDPDRLWLHGYANDFCCYIPSERLLQEGGYGGGAEVVYFALPNTLQQGLERRIVEAVLQQMPARFSQKEDWQKTGGVPPLSPDHSLETIAVREGLTVELAAAEPLVVDPVAIDWGPDGQLWVCEMHDYPTGIDGAYQAGGRIAVLRDADQDGVYDHRTVFAEGLPFPTDVVQWRKGALVCAAPDILYLEDVDGDGRADAGHVVFHGFATDNYQARPNSLRYGLDGWWYGANGLISSEIESRHSGARVDIRGRDFRMRPDTGEFAPVSGLTQQGRSRDDWGNWFGCDSGTLLRHYPLTDRYLARNPHVAPPAAGVFVPNDPDANRLFPLGDLVTFKLSGPPGVPTSACGLDIYRDELLGADFYGNAFTCEPVNQLVHRQVLAPRGVTFASRRADDESEQEFLASSDQWFRPVQVRTGPDGCLWVVDMYRYVIEHPRWIPEETLAMLDVRAGERQGRIYRVRPTDERPRRITRLDQLDGVELVRALDTPNGHQRDRTQWIIIDRGQRDVVPNLEKLLQQSERPATRLAALCTLDGLGVLDARLLCRALTDAHPGVRRHAIRLSEPCLNTSPELAGPLLSCLDDPDPQVRLQLAYSLGQWHDKQAAVALADLLRNANDEPYLLSAIWSSLSKANVMAVLRAATSDRSRTPDPASLSDLIRFAVKLNRENPLERVLDELQIEEGDSLAAWQIQGAASLLEALGDQREAAFGAAGERVLQRLEQLAEFASDVAVDEQRTDEQRLAAARIVAYATKDNEITSRAFLALLGPRSGPSVRSAVVRLAAESPRDSWPELLLAHWQSYAPSLRSEVLDALLTRETAASALVEGLREGTIHPHDVSATRRQRLLTHENQAIRDAASAAFAGNLTSDRQSVVQRYSAVGALDGNAQRGEKIFAKHCRSCHQMQGEGAAVGPDLTALTIRSDAALLESLFDPNRAVDERYQTWVALTDSGLTRSGILTGETANSIMLREQEGKEHNILRVNLEQLLNTRKSLMPEGLEKDLSLQDVADLLEYLANRRPKAKGFEGNQPVVVTPKPDGTILFSGQNGRIYGGDIMFQPLESKTVGHWHGEGDFVAWSIFLDERQTFNAFLTWSCSDDCAGSAFILEGGSPPLHGVVDSTSGFQTPNTRQIGVTTLPAGSSQIILRPDGPLSTRALLDLWKISFTPVDNDESQKPRPVE
ncbi:HEAT repeat domain-containing protein [Pirellulales bacterium]|nr:HEAT repeat domain-containing protein [Pirellulales bacterium]